MATPSSQTIRSESQMVPERPVMPVDLFLAAIEGNSDVLIPRLGLQPEEQTETQVLTEEKDFAKTSILNRPRQLNALSYPMATIEASHSAPEQKKTEHQTVQSELQSATRSGDTILHLLFTKGHNDLALMVFRNDVSLLKSPNKKLETPLHCAAKVENENVIQNLIQIDSVTVKDALQQTNESGETALHVAANYGNIDISIALMKLDPEVAYRINHNMFSALNIAIDREYTEMVLTMLEQDRTLGYTQFSTGMFPVHLAASMGNEKLVLHLMRKYPDHGELLDSHGRNLFHFAAEKDKYFVFFNLFEKNPSNQEMITRMNNAKDYEGNTPLHIAARNGHKRTMYVIWKSKMNLVAETVQNKQGLTPLQLSSKKLVETDKDIDDDDISDYIKREGDKFTQEWFDKVMEPSVVENKWERTQVVGLGSVLITTVAFTAAFTIPGSYNQDTGTPILGRWYIFRAFILANAMAFIQGFLSLFALLWRDKGPIRPTMRFAIITFIMAANSMVMAFGLGTYVTLAPVCYHIAILLLVITLVIGSPTVVVILMTGESFSKSDVNIRTISITYVVCVMFIFCLGFM